MKNLLPLFVACSVPFLLAAPAAGPVPSAVAGQQPSFPSQASLVRIDAVVLDKDERPVEGLGASEFELLEDGRPQQIESFEVVVVRGTKTETQNAKDVPIPRPTRRAPSEGALFVIFYDDLHLTPRYTAPARDAIRRFLAEGTRPGDRVTLVAPEQATWWTARFPDEQHDLLSLVDRLQGRRLRGDGRSDYRGLLVHQRGDEGVIENQMPGALANAAIGTEKSEIDNNRLIQQLAAGTANWINAPPSALGTGHRDLRGMVNPQQISELEADYQEGARLNRLSLDALRDAVSALASVPGRKSLVAVSEGVVDDRELREYEQIVDEARLSNTAVYFLDVRGFEAPKAFEAGAGPLTGRLFADKLAVDELVHRGAAIGSERIADETGGRTLRSNDLGNGLLRVAAEAHSYYLLGYVPADTTPKGFRKITVRVKRPGLKVRSRPGWRPVQTGDAPTLVAAASPAKPTEPSASASAPAVATPSAAAASVLGPPQAPGRALDLLVRSGADLADLPLALSAYVFDETSPGHARVLVAADLDLPPSKTGTQVGYRVMVVPLAPGNGLQHSGTTTLEAAAELPWKGGFGTHAPLVEAFELAPGRYQARLAVELPGRERRGAVTRTFDVPKASGLRLSTPILSNVIGERGERAPRPVLRGLKAFWPNDSLFCQFEVFGAAPGENKQPVVEAGYRVVAANGTVVRSAPASSIQPMDDGRLLRLFGFPLRVLPPGVYTLSVEVRDATSGATVTASDSFRVQSVRR